jgi:hypothetical protein
MVFVGRVVEEFEEGLKVPRLGRIVDNPMHEINGLREQ